MFLSISSPFCSSGLIAYFVSYSSHLLGPFPSSLFLLKPFLILSLLLLIQLNVSFADLPSFLFPFSHQFFFLFSIVSSLRILFCQFIQMPFFLFFYFYPSFWSIFIQSLLASYLGHTFLSASFSHSLNSLRLPSCLHCHENSVKGKVSVTIWTGI